MRDITSTNLEAAFIDQHAAGAFPGKTYAFVAVITERGWGLGVAVENERGYHPVGTKTFGSKTEADSWADGLNLHIGLDRLRAAKIVATTMRNYEPFSLRR